MLLRHITQILSTPATLYNTAQLWRQEHYLTYVALQVWPQKQIIISPASGLRNTLVSPTLPSFGLRNTVSPILLSLRNTLQSHPPCPALASETDLPFLLSVSLRNKLQSHPLFPDLASETVSFTLPIVGVSFGLRNTLQSHPPCPASASVSPTLPMQLWLQSHPPCPCSFGLRNTI